MPQGLEVFNSSGAQIFDGTLSMAKILGQASIGTATTGSTANGTITDSRITGLTGNVPFVAVVLGNTWAVSTSPRFSFSGNVLTWTFPHATLRPDTTFIYGVY